MSRRHQLLSLFVALEVAIAGIAASGAGGLQLRILAGWLAAWGGCVLCVAWGSRIAWLILGSYLAASLMTYLLVFGGRMDQPSYGAIGIAMVLQLIALLSIGSRFQ